jgi:dolichol-phosphate mannosyltransferase
MQNSLVVIPTFNEIENIQSMIDSVFSVSLKFHILVVDDSSPDGTSGVVKKMKIKYPNNLFLLERSTKRGLGTAYIDGFNWGLKKHYEYFFSNRL